MDVKELLKETVRDVCYEHGLDVITEQKEEEAKTLDNLYEKVKNCSNCELARSRKTIVFGDGNHNARLMFIGEGPGYDEDVEGLPFVGAAGRLLTKIINAMGFERKEVYIANIVKCHPMKDPKNNMKRGNDRKPNESEIKSCINILEKQIELIEPKVICTLGSVATESLLKTSIPISRIRGEEHLYKNIKVIPTYHPAYLLRNEREKKYVWEDMKKIIGILK